MLVVRILFPVLFRHREAEMWLYGRIGRLYSQLYIANVEERGVSYLKGIKDLLKQRT